MNFRFQISNLRFLRRYFHSGWAFFIPYLFFYLLYYWRKWPVNPGPGSHLPTLLHVYWALHVLNLILVIIALRAWRQSFVPSTLNPALSLLVVPSNGSQLSALNPQPSVFQSFSFSAFLPWLLLALIFYIPGAYFEWPSDPWEHLRRINEWHGLQAVGDQSTWVKSSYFLAYSLVGRAFGLRQLFWLDFYYTGICLLLCWQYYRLARAVGLGERASLVFVILQAILFGNNIFSFYRYYGISSSIYGQLGAVALTRLGIDFAKSKSLVIGHSSLVIGYPRLSSVLWPLTSAFCLVLFIAFNHVQGIGIAVLGLASVATWRLVAWKRSTGWILLAAAILLSLVTVRWYPRHPAIDQIYRSQGYLNTWYGFNIFSLSSPAGDRMLQIVGAIGLVNLAAGLLLLRRNHLVGWLTIMPVIVLCLPCVAIPFAGLLAQHDTEVNIILFQRMLFAIPIGLALVCLGARIIECQAEKSPGASGWPFFAFALTMGSLLFLTTVSPGRPRYNHFWHALAQTPDDLRMRDIIGAFKTRPIQPDGKELELVTTVNVSAALRTVGIQSITYDSRSIGEPIADSANGTIEALANPRYRSSPLYIPSARELYTATSLAGQLSGHWPSQQVASDYAAGPELEVAARNESWTKLPEPGVTLYNWYQSPQKIEGVNHP